MHSFPTYLDFSLDVSDIDGQAFTVIVRSDIGETREQTHFPFADVELEHYLLKLENAILRSTDLHRANQPSHASVVETFGRALFDFVLPGEARSLYNECLREAEHRHRGVRLKLSIHSPRLAALPWEFLYDPRKRDYVCLNPYTPLVRYTELPQTAPPLQISAPLRILGLLSDPHDMPMRLDVEQERDHVTQAVQSLVDRGLVELTWLEGNSWRDLQRIMRSAGDGWHIFHFIGHGGYDTLRNEGYIVLNNEDGTSHHLYASQLARMLVRQRTTMRLVLLNACEGARAGTHDALSSTAATLIASGIPAVLAMQYEITNDAAVEFANAFYEALADNLPVDAAVAEAGLDVSQVPILMGTLGKALGTAGAFVAGSEELIETLIQHARPYVYTTAMPPAVAEASRVALRIAAEEEWRRERVLGHVQRFRHGAQRIGLNLMASATPIQPVMLGDTALANRWNEALLREGILVGAIRPPTVPEGTARLRITFSAAHTPAHVDALLAVLTEIAAELGQ